VLRWSVSDPALTFFPTAALAPQMAARGGGSIVSITTMAAEIGMVGAAAYGASTAAVAGLTRAWAAEFARGQRPRQRRLPGPHHDLGDRARGQVDEHGLSRREREVLLLVSEGLTNAQVAERLFLSPNTVSTHVSRILRKLGVSTRTQAAAKARDEGRIALSSVRRCCHRGCSCRSRSPRCL
jgi:DNA-binding CsgD family transcriptional regulator